MGFYWLEFALLIWILQRPLQAAEPNLSHQNTVHQRGASMTIFFRGTASPQSSGNHSAGRCCTGHRGLAGGGPGRGQKQLVIGGTAGSNIDQLQYGIVPILQKKGYKVRLVEFNDYVQPNLALADGSLDANFPA
jgi:ABC-type metal ion transport system substrate-binding protein